MDEELKQLRAENARLKADNIQLRQQLDMARRKLGLSPIFDPQTIVIDSRANERAL